MYDFCPQMGAADAQIECHKVDYRPTKQCTASQSKQVPYSSFNHSFESANNALPKRITSYKNILNVCQLDLQFSSHACSVDRSILGQSEDGREQRQTLQESTSDGEKDINSSLKRKREDFLIDLILRGEVDTRQNEATCDNDLYDGNEEPSISFETSPDESWNNTSCGTWNTEIFPLKFDEETTLPPEISNDIESLLADAEHGMRKETTNPATSLFRLIDGILRFPKDPEMTKNCIPPNAIGRQFEYKSANNTGISATTTQPFDVEDLMDPIPFEKSSFEWSFPKLQNFPIEHHSEVRFSNKSSGADIATDGFELPWFDILEDHSEDPLNNDQVNAEINLKRAMKLSSLTTSKLQEWDRANGLPKSHSQTMVNSCRSREQLESGLVLQKWNGSPLLLLPGARVKVRRRTFRGERVVGLPST